MSGKQKIVKTAPQGDAFSKWSFRVLLVAGIWGVCHYLNSINHIFYTLKPPSLHSSVLTAIDQAKSLGGEGNATVVISHVIDQLVKDHPEAAFETDFRNPDKWVFNNAGGAMGSMFLLHASITEYLIIFGSAVGTEGHTGRHTADDYFHILTGRQTAYDAGQLEAQVYMPGDVNLMKRGVVRQYGMDPGTWALEYARGWIPLMLPFGYADSLSSTLDFPTMWRTTYLTGRQIIKNLLRGKI